MRLVARVQLEMFPALDLEALFESSTPRELAGEIARQRAAAVREPRAGELADR